MWSTSKCLKGLTTTQYYQQIWKKVEIFLTDFVVKQTDHISEKKLCRKFFWGSMMNNTLTFSAIVSLLNTFKSF